MKVIAINGSPRKKWNTATLLEKALEGAASKGAETELIHLYDLNYKGCISCFACKTIGGKSYGRCPVKDDLKPVFKKIEEADAIILGSPIYLGRVSGEMASFMERLAFQYMEYKNPPQSLFPGKVKSAIIYTGNVDEEMLKAMGIDKNIEFNTNMMIRVFGNTETLISFDTYQFDDYSKFEVTRFDPIHKAKVREEIFPIDCKKAFEMGAGMVS
ncbi:MAG: flavodoxin family protein [Firmicutes bacterium]|nr:flavodoxin family protein [Bacillota bacterium]